MPWLNELMPNSSKVNFIVFLICLLAHIIDACVLVDFSCADWLVPGLPAMVYNPVVFFFIYETTNTAF